MSRIHARHLRQTLGFTASALVLAVLPLACGRQANPSPTNAALNAPEGSPERAPTRPDDLKPPATPPSPGHIGQ